MQVSMDYLDIELENIHRQNAAVRKMESCDERLAEMAKSLLNTEDIVDENTEINSRIAKIRSEIDAYVHEIRVINSVENEVHLSARLSEVLNKTYDTPSESNDYKTVLLREGAVRGIVAFRNKMQSITEMVRDYKKAGFSVGVNALSFSLEQWYESIKNNPRDAILFARIISTHDACVRQYFEPQMVVNHFLQSLPDKKTLMLACEDFARIKSGDDFEEWRLSRAKTILKSFGVFDDAGNFNKNGLNLTCPEDLIGRIPEHSLMTAFTSIANGPNRFGFYFNSPLGISKALGIQSKDYILDAYDLKIANVNMDLIDAYSSDVADNKLGI